MRAGLAVAAGGGLGQAGDHIELRLPKLAALVRHLTHQLVAVALHAWSWKTSTAAAPRTAASGEAGDNGRRIEFWGVGNSGIVAQDAHHKFFRLGVHSGWCSDGHVLLMSATMLGPGDCAVLFSNSGRSRDLLDAAETARKKGATLIILTSSGSPLAQMGQSAGQILLAVDHPEDWERYSPMVSRLLHLVVIDILTTAVALRMPAELRPVLQEIKRNLRTRRYANGPG